MSWLYVAVLAVGIELVTPTWPWYRKLGVYLLIAGTVGLVISYKEAL